MVPVGAVRVRGEESGLGTVKDDAGDEANNERDMGTRSGTVRRRGLWYWSELSESVEERVVWARWKTGQVARVRMGVTTMWMERWRDGAMG